MNRQELVKRAVHLLEVLRENVLENKSTFQLKLLAFIQNDRFMAGESYSARHYDLSNHQTFKEYTDESLKKEIENI